MAGPVVCMLCDKREEECTCDRYCNLCKGQYGVRLCLDGQYYCPDCREAVDIHTAEGHG